MAKYKKWKDKYEVLSELGEGGNAKVYHVKSKESNEVYALKELQVGGEEKHGRFVDEINIIKANSIEIEGIIPVLDYSIDEYWYTMPIAKPIMQYITENELTIEKIVEGVIQLCSTLEKLHEKGVSHRDIKPSNIYYYNNIFCFGDFGLVDFPESENDFTRSDKGLGAIFTISPEMKRNPKQADGRKADVFSMAKTMWMFLTKDEKGFDGVYSYLDTNHSLRYFDKYKNELLVDAIKNAESRVFEILKVNNNKTGDLKKLIQGQFEIQDDIENIDDIKKNNINQKFKKLRVVVTAIYSIEKIK